ncbi:hypothetical protein IG631_06342 [Alternaria alternata]|nr:hypothetical protein IG631_06342 [Alternaria alternata]
MPNWSKMRATGGQIISAAPLTETILSCFSRTTWSMLASCKAWESDKPTMPAPTMMTLNGFEVVESG